MEFTLIQTVTNITNATTMVKQLSVFVHLDYFSVQIISIVIGQPMSFVLILAQVIPLKHQRHQQQRQQQRQQRLQQQLQQQPLQLQLRHQLQHLQHQHQLEVKLTRTFVKISRTVSILLQTVPSIISVTTMV